MDETRRHVIYAPEYLGLRAERELQLGIDHKNGRDTGTYGGKAQLDGYDLWLCHSRYQIIFLQDARAIALVTL